MNVQCNDREVLFVLKIVGSNIGRQPFDRAKFKMSASEIKMFGTAVHLSCASALAVCTPHCQCFTIMINCVTSYCHTQLCIYDRLVKFPSKSCRNLLEVDWCF